MRVKCLCICIKIHVFEFEGMFCGSWATRGHSPGGKETGKRRKDLKKENDKKNYGNIAIHILFMEAKLSGLLLSLTYAIPLVI